MHSPPRIAFGAFAFLFAAAIAFGSADHYQTGLAYERLGRYPEAYTELQLASNLSPEDAQVAAALGIVATRLGNYEEALRALEHSITLEAGSCASYFELAFLYEKKNMPERAVESWNRFLALSQDEPLKRIARKHIAYLQARP
jgi:tetratricopeptide (TPR) repeat protein